MAIQTERQERKPLQTQHTRALSPTEAGRIEVEIRECLNEWIYQITNGSSDSVSDLYSDGAVLLATFDPTPLNTPVGRKNYFVQLMARDSLKAELGDYAAEVIDANSGMVNGLYTFSYLDEHKKLKEIQARFTFVYLRNTEGSWRIGAHHSSITPLRPVVEPSVS